MYEPTIGLEIHIQLNTETKMFCSCPIVGYDVEPNTDVCPVCMGLPGALPVPNKKAVHYSLMLANVLGCEINRKSVFARKNYFYPDLPKGYQITQDEVPVAEKGQLKFKLPNGEYKTVRINRIHMEEDAGKSYHIGSGEISLIDFNRCGVPLIEIVSEPDMHSPAEAALYVKNIKQIVTYLGISSADMEKGNLRVDANVSVKRKDEIELGTRTELKNLNSFKFIQKAIEYEINRHINCIESGGFIVTQTLLWDEKENRTFPMRTKEELSDYRYFPEPDILCIYVNENEINHASESVGELPWQRISRFIRQYNISNEIAEKVCATKGFSDYADKVLKITSDKRITINWLLIEVLRVLNEEKISIDEFTIEPKNLAELLDMISSKKISNTIGKKVFREMIRTGEDSKSVLNRLEINFISDENELEKIIETIIAENLVSVNKYKSGKINVIGFFMGQVMKKTKGQADPRKAKDILIEKLNR